MSASDRARVVVVGGGVVGAATADALARAGHEVEVLERWTVGHRHGSSHGTSRIFRLSYADPRWVRMAAEALPLWQDLADGRAILQRTGGLDLGAGAQVNAAALEAAGAPFEWVGAEEARTRWPGLSLPAGADALHQPDAGLLRADLAWRALVMRALAAGATWSEGTRVVALTPREGGVRVEVEDGHRDADVAVVTAGAWSRALLAGCGIDVPVVATRQTVAYYRVPDWRAVPSLVEWGEPARYLLGAPDVGLKAGEHHVGPVTDPEEAGEPDEAAVTRITHWVRQRVPGVDPVPAAAETCLYTNTADEDFVLARHGNVVVGSACSGHGFKFAPVVGARLAALATG